MGVDAPAQPATATAPEAQRERYRFTQREYYAMVEAGLFTEDSRVELIRGDIVPMAPIDAPHAGALKDLVGMVTAGLAGRAVFGVQDPISIGTNSEPQPDLSICQLRPGGYRRSHPKPDDILLVVEIADSSINYDRYTKMPLYAAAGIAEAWLLDLNKWTLEVYRTPGADDYRSLQRLTAGDTIAPLAFPDLILEVAALLPPTEQGS